VPTFLSSTLLVENGASAPARPKARRPGGASRFVAPWVLAFGILIPAAAEAQEHVDDATKNAARDLAQRAAQAYESGDHRTAQDLFRRAYALVPAPTLSVREARALEKMGLLVEAAEAYVRTSRTRLDASAPDVFKQAVPDSPAEVTMDGRKLRPELVGVESPANPGLHQLTATTSSGAGASAEVTLAEGESKSVLLRLEAGKAASITPVAPASPRTGTTAQTTPAPGSGGSPGKTQRTLAYVSLGVGAVGLGAGVITGLMASSRHSSAEEKCPDGRCIAGSDGADDLDAFRSLRTVSTIGYVVGLVGAGAGITLLLTSPASREAAWVSPYVAPSSAGVTGAF